jgi:hypothetical protein
MPLDKTCSIEAFNNNIRRSIKEGKPQKQSVAIAYSILRKACEISSDQPQMTPSEIVKTSKKKGEKKMQKTNMEKIDILLEKLKEELDTETFKIGSRKTEEISVRPNWGSQQIKEI